MAKTTASRKSHGMRTVRNLISWMKSLKATLTSLLNENYIIYNFRNVYQTKDIQPWSESLKAFKFESSRRVIIVHLHIAVVKVLRKTLIAKCIWQTLSQWKLFSTRTLIIVPLSLLWLPWHQFKLDASSWFLASFRVRDTKYIFFNLLQYNTSTHIIYS